MIWPFNKKPNGHDEPAAIQRNIRSEADHRLREQKTKEQEECAGILQCAIEKLHRSPRVTEEEKRRIEIESLLKHLDAGIQPH